MTRLGQMFERSHCELKQWLAKLLHLYQIPVLTQQDLKGQTLLIRFA